MVEGLPASKDRSYLRRQVLERPAPSYAVWELTLACDQRCVACGPRAGQARDDELTTDEALTVVDELAALGVGEVTLIGGEAYLRNDVMQIVRRIRERGMRATLTTGGFGLTETRAEGLAAAGTQQVSVSIDGLEATHDALRRSPGGWQRCFDALATMRKHGVTVTANTQINARTKDELVELGELLADAGVVAWQFIMTIAHGGAGDHPDLLLQPYELIGIFETLERVLDLCDARGIKFWPGNNIGYFGPLEHRMRKEQNADAHYRGCQAGTSGIGIESNGAIKSCPSLGGPANTGGSWRDEGPGGLETIWKGAPEIRALGKRTVDDLWGFCRDCYYGPMCLGGCSATTEPLLGRPGNNPYCHHRVLELDKQGLRERVEPVRAADPKPFGMGTFRVVVESADAGERAEHGSVVVYDARA